jgi:hypothetical protein
MRVEESSAAPTVPVTFRTTPEQLEQLQAAIPTYRRATGGDTSVSDLVRRCVHIGLTEHIARLTGGEGVK